MVLLLDYLPHLGKQPYSLSLKEESTDQGWLKTPAAARPRQAQRAWDHSQLFAAIFPQYAATANLSAPNLWEVSMHTYLHLTPPHTRQVSQLPLPSPLSHSDIQVLRCLWPASSKEQGQAWPVSPTLMCEEGLYNTAHPKGEQIAFGSWTAQSYLVRDGLAFRHRTAIQAGKDCGRSSNPTKLGQLHQGAQGLVLPLLSISEDGPLGPEPCAHAPGFDHPHGENTFPNMPCSCCLSSQQCMSLRSLPPPPLLRPPWESWGQQ